MSKHNKCQMWKKISTSWKVALNNFVISEKINSNIIRLPNINLEAWIL